MKKEKIIVISVLIIALVFNIIMAVVIYRSANKKQYQPQKTIKTVQANPVEFPVWLVYFEMGMFKQPLWFAFADYTVE